MKTLILILLLIAPTFAQSFEAIFETPNITDKKEIWHTLTKDEKDEARRLNYAWGIENLELDQEKIDYLDRLSKSLPLTKDEINDFETEALILFTHKEGMLLFGSIGPYKPCKEVVFIEFQANKCNCAMTSNWNTCTGNCGPSVCRWTEDGCAFGWLHPCTSVCVY